MLMVLSKSFFCRALLLCFPILWDSNYRCLFSFLDLNFEVKLPELLFHASIEEKTLVELQAHLIDFLRFQCFCPSFMLEIVIGDEFNRENIGILLTNFDAKLSSSWCRFLQKNQSTFFLSTYHVAEGIENSTNKQGD